MFKSLAAQLAAVVLVPLSLLPLAPAQAQAQPGQAAPAIATVDVAGKPVNLAAFKGRYVVLEWFNPSCPFVVKHYASGNMQSLQKRFTGENVAWIAINSTAADHPEFLQPAKAGAWMTEQKGTPTHVVLDAPGTIGRAFGARTTPQMVIIDPKGQVVFNGAIDSIRSANAADVPKATNFLVQAFGELRAGKPVSNASPAPYGCSVKYAAG
jgi:peroxiredoxin